MSEKNDKDLYLNFDEYIRQGDPQKKERAEAWRVAIGLQAVDGLKVSDYLLELAQKNMPICFLYAWQNVTDMWIQGNLR